MPHKLRTLGVAGAVLALVIGLTGCVTKSLVRAKYEEEKYSFKPTLQDTIPKDTMQFVTFGDTQTGWRAEHRFYRSENWFTWRHAMFPFYQFYLLGNAFVGAANYYRGVPDYGTWSREFMSNAITREANQVNAEFLLFLGDAVDDGRRAEHWSYFLDDFGPLLEAYPFLPIPGNHEFSSDSLGWRNYQAIFNKPRFYTLDTPQVAFFLLDSNYIIDQHSTVDDDRQDRLWRKWFVSADTSDRRSWLEKKLEAREDRPFKVVAMHHPPVSFSWHLEDWYEPIHGRNLLEKRAELLKLLQEYDVQVIFGGHEHLYEHNTLRYKSEESTQRIHQIISSGGGTPPRKVATPSEMDRRRALYDEQGLDVKPQRQVSTFHYTTVRVQPDAMKITTYSVGEYDPHRVSQLDQITISRPAWASQPGSGQPSSGIP